MGEPLAPLVNSLSEPFWTAAAEGCLALPHCVETRRPFWPPSPASPFVTGGAVEWRDTVPEGALRTRAVYRRRFQKALEVPYAIGLVELEGGVRLQAHIPDPDDESSPQAGDAVTLYFQSLRGDCPPVPHARRK